MHALEGVGAGMFVDEEGNEKTFSWQSREEVEIVSGEVMDAQ